MKIKDSKGICVKLEIHSIGGIGIFRCDFPPNPDRGYTLSMNAARVGDNATLQGLTEWGEQLWAEICRKAEQHVNWFASIEASQGK